MRGGFRSPTLAVQSGATCRHGRIHPNPRSLTCSYSRAAAPVTGHGAHQSPAKAGPLCRHLYVVHRYLDAVCMHFALHHVSQPEGQAARRVLEAAP